MGKFRTFIRKCPLKIHIYWSWNYKSKKQKLKDEIEDLKLRIRQKDKLLDLCEREKGEIAVKTYIQQETAKAELEAEQ